MGERTLGVLAQRHQDLGFALDDLMTFVLVQFFGTQVVEAKDRDHLLVPSFPVRRPDGSPSNAAGTPAAVGRAIHIALINLILSGLPMISRYSFLLMSLLNFIIIAIAILKPRLFFKRLV